MSRLTALLALIAAPAFAEHPASLQVGLSDNGDRIWLEADASDRATLHYLNDAAMNSVNGTYTLQLNDVVVKVTIKLSQDGTGIETVTAIPTSGHIAIPETAGAQDGETASILIVLPMF